jgi:hypothetical protein
LDAAYTEAYDLTAWLPQALRGYGAIQIGVHRFFVRTATGETPAQPPNSFTSGGTTLERGKSGAC